MKRTLVSSLALGLSALAFPVMALAATPQQIIDSLNSSAWKNRAMSMEGTMEISLKERALVRGTDLTELMASMRLKQRVVPTSQLKADSEGRFSLEKGQVKTTGVAPENITLDGPIAVQWKYVGGVVYLRVESLPSMVREVLAADGFEIDHFLGVWIRLDAALMNELEVMSLDTSVPLSDSQSLMEQLGLKGIKQPFLAQRLEKRTKDASGDSIVRIRARLNPSILRALLQKNLAAIDRKSPTRQQQINDTYAEYNKAVRVVNSLSFVFVINETKKELTRIELGGTFTQPRQECTWNAAGREICKNVASQTVRVLAGFSFLKDSGTPVEIPSSSVTPEEIVQKLMPPAPEPTEEYPYDATDTWDYVPNGSSTSMTQTLTAE